MAFGLLVQLQFSVSSLVLPAWRQITQANEGSKGSTKLTGGTAQLLRSRETQAVWILGFFISFCYSILLAHEWKLEYYIQ